MALQEPCIRSQLASTIGARIASTVALPGANVIINNKLRSCCNPSVTDLPTAKIWLYLIESNVENMTALVYTVKIIQGSKLWWELRGQFLHLQ